MIASKGNFGGKEQCEESAGVRQEQLREPAEPRNGRPPLAQPSAKPMRSRFAEALARLYARLVGKADPRPDEEEPAFRSADDSPNHNCERRSFPRRDSGCDVSVCLRGETGLSSEQQMAWRLHASSRKGSLADVSMNGVAFLLNEPIEEGQEILLRLTNRQFAKNIDTHARVLRTLADEDGQWKIVCQFHENLDFEQINDLGRHLFQSDLV